jgi:ferredoxin
MTNNVRSIGMGYNVKFVREEKIKKEKTVLDVAEDLNIKIKSPCDGKGKCGRCLIKITSGDVSEVSKKEKELISGKKLESGYRLACETKIYGDVEIEY